MVHHVVEDDVVTLLAAGEVLFDVGDDVIRAEGADQLEVPGAAHAGDLRTERLGDLHRQRPDAPRRTVDQNPGPRPDPAHVPDGDQRGQARHDRCRGRFEWEAGGLPDELGRRCGDEFRERAACGQGGVPQRPEHLVAGFETGHILADGLDNSSDIGSPHRVDGFRSPDFRRRT